MGFHNLFLKHIYVKFGDPSYIGFWDVMRKNTQIQKGGKNLPPTTAVGLANN